LFFAIEMNGQVCGYKEMHLERVLTAAGEMNLLTEKMNFRMNLMGKQIFTKGAIDWFFDTTMQQLTYSSVSIDQGNMHIRSSLGVTGDTVRIKSSSDNRDELIILAPDVRFENNLYRKYLLSELPQDTSASLNVQMFNEMKGRTDNKTYQWAGRDTLWLVEKQYLTIRVNEVNQATGENSELWLEEETGLIVQAILYTTNLKFYLTDRDIPNRLASARVDDILFYQVDTIIPNFKNLSRMKVKAVINSAGELLSAEDLNYPGQKFTGTVDKNIIDGIFEVSHPRYDGKNAPGFPYDYPVDSAMQKYLEPEFLLESDNPKIRKKAQEIAGTDAATSWEAVKKLSFWVGTNIKDAIPGGGSAIGTLEIMKGECGGHSRLLAAFCRSLGIPARISIGCMYIAENSGFFGQHAWTEVYMGEAGWIPVDATLSEFDYIDSGHIRLGESSSFHPQEIEILEYSTGSENTASSGHKK
ncbi:transglutaminase family protein, partial [Bacteroidota bacterium]